MGPRPPRRLRRGLTQQGILTPAPWSLQLRRITAPSRAAGGSRCRGRGSRWHGCRPGPGQIPPAQVIHRLRELDVPLAEVRAILATDDPQRRADLIGGHLRRLEDELDRTRAAVVSQRQLLRPDPAGLDVALRSEPVRTVAAVSGPVLLAEARDWYDAAMANSTPAGAVR